MYIILITQFVFCNGVFVFNGSKACITFSGSLGSFQAGRVDSTLFCLGDWTRRGSLPKSLFDCLLEYSGWVIQLPELKAYPWLCHGVLCIKSIPLNDVLVSSISVAGV